MFRAVAILVAILALLPSMAEAQRPVRLAIGVGFGRFNGGGLGGVGGCGCGAVNGPFPTFNALQYSQQLYQQQAFLTQQVFQQQQQAIIDQIRNAQGRLAQLEAVKQEMFQRYLEMSDLDQSAVRARLINDYLNLDDRRREGWKRDAVVRHIVGPDLKRLDGVVQFRTMHEPERTQFQAAMLAKYQALPAQDQEAWQSDAIVAMILGKDWWKRPVLRG